MACCRVNLRIHMCVCVFVYNVCKWNMFTGDSFMRVYLRPQRMQLISARAYGVNCQVASMDVLVYIGDLSLIGC